MADHLKTMLLEDWLDDLCARFIINLPAEDLSSVERICFQVEEAQWFYEDFIRPLDPTLPSMTLREFCLRIFRHCPLLSSFPEENHMKAFENWMEYKTRVPVRGAILLNDAMDHAVLVKGWKKNANWSFPRGKINKDEPDLVCAIREVEEETGLRIDEAGLLPEDEEPKSIEINMREQQIKLFVFRNVPMDTKFQPKTRKEISRIQWWKLSELPAFRKRGGQQADRDAGAKANKFYMVAPFLVQLRKWVVQQKRKDAQMAARRGRQGAQGPHDDGFTEDDAGVQTGPLDEQELISPSIDTLAGANAELKRLLNIQPPTQDFQIDPAGVPVKDKGSAIMALLHGTGGDNDDMAPRPPPHALLDHTYSEVPQSQSPHHHHTQQPPTSFSTYQKPPPSFSYQHTHERNFHQSYYQGQGPADQGHHEHNIPHDLSPRRLRNESVPLMHPQPLPPQVQTGLLNHGIASTPAVPPQVNYNPAAHATHQNSLGQAAPSGMTYTKPPPPQLNSHTMSLLNAFKTDKTTVANPPNIQSGQQYMGLNVPKKAGAAVDGAVYDLYSHQQGPYPSQHVPAASTGMPSQASPRAIMQPQHGIPQEQPNPTLFPPTDKHRSSLLEMFKSSEPVAKEMQSGVPSGSMQSSGVASNRSHISGSHERRAPDKQTYPLAGTYENQGNGVSLSSNNSRKASGASQTRSAAEAVRVAAREGSGPLQMHSEMTLPYHPVTALQHPKATGSSPRNSGAFPSPKAPPQSVGSPLAAQFRNSDSPGTHSSKQPYQMPRRKSLAKQSFAHDRHVSPPVVSPYGAPEGRTGAYSGMTSPTAGSSFSGPGVIHRRQDTNSEQKQKLLALFGKPTGDDKTLSNRDNDMASASGTPRSHVLSLASGQEESGSVSMSRKGSRRGSQTPISPADRNFLLGFLDKQASKAGPR